jgi:predicted aldo/keto reductase-like oxidoreductase
MKYRINPKTGDKVSILAFGCMRFAKPESAAERHVLAAFEGGLNYFDTAFMYPGNEAALGRILAKNNLRKRVFIATKVPPYFIKKTGDFDRIFNQQLEQLQTDYVDYYFMHMLTRVSDWQRICALGVQEWIAAKKAAGQIRSIGFSYHGGRDEFPKIIDAYDWDHCMIQYNYFDEFNQAGKTGLQYAASKGIPVMIMEPLHGGQLVHKLPKEVRALCSSAEPRQTPAEWAFRWVWNHREALTVLSGMNSDVMIAENLRTASDAEADTLTAEDLALYEKAREILWQKTSVPCTGCGYCMPCPGGVNIPVCFASYNDYKLFLKFHAIGHYIIRAGEGNASKCTGCGKCEPHCPQGIPIRNKLKDVSREMEGIVYRVAKPVFKAILQSNKKA